MTTGRDSAAQPQADRAGWSRGGAMIRRRFVAMLACGLVAGIGWAGAAQAQGYPNRTVRIIAPYTPGSPNDVMVRLLGQHLQTSLGQPVIIENRPGGGTSIGTKAVAVSPADGYTLLYTSSSLVIDPILNNRTDYDPLKEFVPVATVTTTPMLLVVTPSVPARTVKEFIAYAAANPGKLHFGFAQGATGHFTGNRFKALTRTDIVNVPYKGGAAAMPDFLAGRIQMLFPTPATMLEYIRDGQARALAITSPARSADLPDVPTMREVGLPELTIDLWAGILAPIGTPADVVDRLNAAINAALRSPEMKASMSKLGFEAKIGSPQDFSAFIADEIPRWIEMAKSNEAMSAGSPGRAN